MGGNVPAQEGASAGTDALQSPPPPLALGGGGTAPTRATARHTPHLPGSPPPNDGTSWPTVTGKSPAVALPQDAVTAVWRTAATSAASRP